MRYHDTPERSAELLRQALPLMSRQAAALTPVAYAVWYGYVANPGSALRADVDAHLAQHGTLDDRATQLMFERHVAFDARDAERVAEELNSVIGDIGKRARAAQDETSRYGAELQRAASQLGGDAAPGATQGVVQDLLRSTATMQTQVGGLREQLEARQREIDELRREVRRAREASLVDALTGLQNRRGFDEELDAVIAATSASEPQRPALLMVDIDHFKRINDHYGHPFGDQVLKVVAQAMRACAPPPAQVARHGGEEFAVLLPGADAALVKALGERLRTTVAGSRIRRKGHDDQAAERVTISIGTALHQPGESATGLIDRADRALYRSKSAGRDRVTAAD